jgi:hypothetical protein
MITNDAYGAHENVPKHTLPKEKEEHDSSEASNQDMVSPVSNKVRQQDNCPTTKLPKRTLGLSRVSSFVWTNELNYVDKLS